ERAADTLAGEILGVVLERTVVPALVAARVDEGLDAAELPARVDAVQSEGRAASAPHRARHREVPGDLAAGLRVRLVDLRERQPEHEARDLPRRLVLQAAGLVVEFVLALVRLGRVPESLAIVVMELVAVDRDDLEPVLALLEPLEDRLGEEVFPLLPVVRVERPRLVVARGARLRAWDEGPRDERGGAEADRRNFDLHRVLHRMRDRPGFGRLRSGCQGPGAAARTFSSSHARTAPTSITSGSPARRT